MTSRRSGASTWRWATSSASTSRTTSRSHRPPVSYVAGEPPTEHVHIAFGADTNEAVDAFHRAAIDAGYTDNGAPGERAAYHPGYYGAFVLDPDGHNIEAVNHNRSGTHHAA